MDNNYGENGSSQTNGYSGEEQINEQNTLNQYRKEQQEYNSTMNSQSDYSQTGNSNADYSNAGYSNAGYSNAGYNNTGYSNAGYNNTGYNQQSYGNQGYNGSDNRKKKKKLGLFKKAVALIGAAVIFGVVAGGTMLGVYALGKDVVSDNNNGSALDQEIQTVNPGTINGSSSIVADENTKIEAEMDVSAVAKATLPAMVALEGTVTVSGSSSPFYGYGGSYESATSGTGIIVGKNDTELLVLTNAHVIDGVNNLSCVFIDGEKVSAVVKGSKTDKDIAVCAIKLSDIKTSTASSIAIAELGDSDNVELGQEVVAIGNALGEGQSVTNGIISAVDRSIVVNNVTFEGLFMTNAAINSGNSGGALIDADGKVIAINFAKTSETGVEGMAYSIPVSNVRELIDKLMNRETRQKVSDAEASYLGISAIDITSSMAEYYGYPQGIQIRSVAEGSAAEKAGLGKYDIIVSFDDQSITSMSGLQNTLQYYKAGETVTIEYYHIEGNQYVLKTATVVLDKKQ